MKEENITLDFWNRKSYLKNKPCMKNKTIGILEETAKKYKISISEVIEKFIDDELNYEKEHKSFKDNFMQF